MSGVWRRVFEVLAQDAGNQYAISMPPSCMLTRTELVQKGDSNKQVTGRSHDGLSTKIHATVDALAIAVRQLDIIFFLCK